MKVEDIMTREVVSVKPETSVREIAHLISEHNFNGVPVIEGEKVVGMITENDFLTHDFEKIHIPSLIKIIKDLKVSKYLTKNNADISEILSANAESIMNKEFVSIRPDKQITELVKIFREKNINPIPVLDEENKLVGIVSKSDVLGIISRIRNEEMDFLAMNNN